MEAEEAGRRREGSWGAGARPLQRCLGLRLYPDVGGKTIAPLGPKALGSQRGRCQTETTQPRAPCLPPAVETGDTGPAEAGLAPSSPLCFPPDAAPIAPFPGSSLPHLKTRGLG